MGVRRFTPELADISLVALSDNLLVFYSIIADYSLAI